MTREYKVGMTGKTTKGFDWSIFGDRGGSTEHVLRIATYDAARVVVDKDWITVDGRGYCAEQEFGALIHPDDAKEETQCGSAETAGMEPSPMIEARNPVMEDMLREFMGKSEAINWEAVRINAACAALTGLMHGRTEISKRDAFEIGDLAVLAADAVIARLSEKEG